MDMTRFLLAAIKGMQYKSVDVRRRNHDVIARGALDSTWP